MNKKNRNFIVSAYILSAAYISTAYHYIRLVQRDFYLSLIAAILLNGLLAYCISKSQRTRTAAALLLTIFMTLSLLHLLPNF